MDEFAKMDIFFVVSTSAVVILALLLAIVIYRILKILSYVERVTKLVTEEGELIRMDINELRTAVKREGFKFSHLAQFARKRARSFMGGRKKGDTSAD